MQAERRDRLRSLLASMDDEELDAFSAGPAAEFIPQEPGKAELFYTEGSPALREARLQVGRLSELACRLAQLHCRAVCMAEHGQVADSPLLDRACGHALGAGPQATGQPR